MNKKELTLFTAVSLIAAFIFSEFRYAGVRTIDYVQAVFSLIEYILIFLFLYGLFILAQKNIAKRQGLKAEFEVWQFGPLIAVLVTFMTYGLLPFLYMGNVHLTPIRRLRIGRLEKAVNTREMAAIGVAGPLVLLLLSILILEPLYFLTNNEFFVKIMYTASLLILFTTLPLPHTNGTNIILYSRTLWAALLVFSILNFVLIGFLNFYSFLTALLITPIALYILYKMLTKD